MNKLLSTIRSHLTRHHLSDKISELIVGGFTITRFYIRGYNNITGETIDRTRIYEILKFLSGIIYLYLQIAGTTYLIEYHSVYTLGRRFDFIINIPPPFHTVDPTHAGKIYVVSQVLYWGAYAIRGYQLGMEEPEKSEGRE